MNRLKPWIIAALAAAMTLSIISVASAQPTPPALFTGTVTDADGDPAASGLSVEAWVGDTNCTQSPSMTSSSSGATKYFVAVENSSTNDGCAGGGAEVRFRIGGQWAAQTGVVSGGYHTLNLTLGPPTVIIEVSVWRLQSDPTRLFVSTRAPGESWITHRGQLVMTEYIGTNRWDRSDPKPVDVTLPDGSSATIEVSVWRLQADPTRLFVSTRAPGDSWITHRGQLVMTEYIGTNRWDRSDPKPVQVELE